MIGAIGVFEFKKLLIFIIINYNFTNLHIGSMLQQVSVTHNTFHIVEALGFEINMEKLDP